MKRILAMLASLWFAIANNIGYQASADVPYQAGEYFVIEEGFSPDYRSLYDKQPIAGGNNNCFYSTHPVQSGLHLYTGDDLKQYEDLCAFTKDAYKEWKTGNIPDTTGYAPPAGSYIYSPFAGKILSNPTTSDGTAMEVRVELSNGEKYVISITGMECWYCDIARDLSVVEPDKFHTYSDLGKAATVKAGSLLGVAGDNCNIMIVREGSSVKISDFYKTPKVLTP